MKHLIIGGGNLGLDVAAVARRRGQEAIVLTRSSGFDVENPTHVFDAVGRSDYDALWYCVGGGSISAGSTRQEREQSARINLTIPGVIAGWAPADRRLVFFSSDVCADESAPDRPERRNPTPLSDFAHIKLVAETQLLRRQRPLLTVVRVGSLYGWHKPTDTFPGRMLERFGFDRSTSIEIPSNLVTPTPTLWVAAQVLEYIDPSGIGLTKGRNRIAPLLHCSPRGNVSIRDWAILTLQGLREAAAFAPETWFDRERPALSALGCSFASVPHWFDVWKVYFRQAWFTPSAHRHLLPPSDTAPPGGGGDLP